jgi:hypothetical protein
LIESQGFPRNFCSGYCIKPHSSRGKREIGQCFAPKRGEGLLFCFLGQAEEELGFTARVPHPLATKQDLFIESEALQAAGSLELCICFIVLMGVGNTLTSQS